ncbi:hypothetical protein QTH87_23540 [Variovorax sp. J22P168]|uniref:hypothetical protein n=1 Tax=Variovorax jilinensis TaxID=3053513 RepID=UPI0025786147|nr:hypothetical protein [Variovorax sp. J22P168]MDM0015437.1 hypothetical protein [Variovorax sp. J22P168]
MSTMTSEAVSEMEPSGKAGETQPGRSVAAPAGQAVANAKTARAPATGTGTGTSSRTPGSLTLTVGRHVEENTRFRSADLSEECEQTSSAMQGTLMLSQQVGVTVQTNDRAGPLPGGVQVVQSEQAMLQGLRAMHERCIEELPARIDAWASRDDGTYRRLLPRGDVLSGFEHMLGHQYQCGVCSGRGEVRCRNCSGEGEVQCVPCHGKGRISCTICYGTSKRDCSRCSGRGNYSESYIRDVWDSGAKTYVTRTDWRTVQCMACSGGKVQCTYCQHDGRNQCSSCAGRGVCNCGTCGATGTVDCQHCAATGCRHCLGQLSCEIASHDQLTLQHSDEEAKELARAHIDVKSLPDYGRRGRTTHRRHDERAVSSAYPVSVEVTRAQIAVGKASFSVHAFGKQQKVFDFKNIVGHLLAKDLHELQSCVQSTSLSVDARELLLERATAFLESEINMKIAEGVLASKNFEEAVADVRSHYKNLVDDRYVAQASTVLEKVLGKLFGGRMFKPGVYWVGLLTLGTCAATLTQWPGGWYGAVACVLGAGPVWGLLEWRARQCVEQDFFDFTIGARMKSLIDKSGLAWRLRGTAFVIACAFAASAFWGTQYLASRYKAHFGGPEDIVAKREARRDTAEKRFTWRIWPDR